MSFVDMDSNEKETESLTDGNHAMYVDLCYEIDQIFRYAYFGENRHTVHESLGYVTMQSHHACLAMWRIFLYN
jgi:hypothetical protein